MFPAWRLKIREAKLAFQQGRLDEAGELLDGGLREYLPGRKLSEKIAARIAERAKSRIAAGETSAGWHDLDIAERLADGSQAVTAVRDALVAEKIQHVQDCLAAGEPELAMAHIAKMERRSRLTAAGQQWKEIASLLQQARRTAARGHFKEALEAVQAAECLLPADSVTKVKDHLETQKDLLTRQAEQFRQLSGALHLAVSSQDWSKVLTAAEEMLAVAPASTVACDARRQAWDAVGLKTTQLHRGQPPRGPRPIEVNHRNSRSTHVRAANAKVDTVTERTPAQRWLMWVDGIGGYFVVHGEEIVIGQPAGQSDVDLPIQADISRRHAVIRRDGGAYVLSPVQETQINGRRIDGPTVLADNDLIVLGEAVKLRFRKPHALSATARLDLECNHKTQPRADGVILMADTLVLGPKSHSHIRCREWAHDVILFRRGEGVQCRTTGTLHIDGKAFDQHGPVAIGSQVEGEDFSLSLEAV